MDLSKEWHRSEFLNLESSISHREIEEELPFYAAIAAGDIEAVEANCAAGSFADPTGMGKLSEDALKNIRYHFIVTIALAVRYCIHAGMEQEKAYAFSDFAILSMDGLKTIKDIVELHDKTCMDLCRQMKLIRTSNILSKPVVLCIDYIYSHIHQRIRLEDLAEAANVSTSYLSRLFVKEMGINISSYILELKLDKSKNLLKYSDYSITEISSYLSFSSQSYFIDVFKKGTGLTPHKYRMKYFRKNWRELSKWG